MKKVLVADDDAAARELLYVTLEVTPYAVLATGDGDEALALAQTEQPDLILLDVAMPGTLDGLEVCWALKHDVRTAHAVVILVTAHGQAWDKQAGVEAGADGYLVKPFSPSELLANIDALMNREIPPRANNRFIIPAPKHSSPPAEAGR